MPRIIDNDRDEIRAELDGREIRSWEYHSEGERRVKMRMAREFAEGWFQATKLNAARADVPHPHVSGELAGKPRDECALCGRDIRNSVHAVTTRA